MAEQTGPGGAPPGAPDTRTTSEAVASLVANVLALFRTQVELAKLEVAGIVRDKAVAVGLLLTAAVLGLFVIAFLGVTAGTALQLVLQPWAAWLVVAGAFLLVVFVLVLVAVRLLKRPSSPQRTTDEVKRTVAWAKGQVQR